MNAKDIAAYLRSMDVTSVSLTSKVVLSSVEPEIICAYLRSPGWDEQETLRNRTWFRKDGYHIEVPNSNHWDDYHLRVSETLTTLTHVEQRFPFEILEDILAYERSL